VVERKKQHIKGKLQDKFPSAEKCFSALDEDGGGSLDRFFGVHRLNCPARSHVLCRVEISRGLRQCGIWLHPNELNSFLEVLSQRYLLCNQMAAPHAQRLYKISRSYAVAG
jgi:hypothetical protein